MEISVLADRFVFNDNISVENNPSLGGIQLTLLPGTHLIIAEEKETKNVLVVITNKTENASLLPTNYKILNIT